MSGLLERVRARFDEALELPTPQMAKAIRESAGATQQELGEELRVHRVTIARWEAGTRRPRGDLGRRYAELLRALQTEVRG